MGKVVPIQDNWSRGMKRDMARSDLPPGTAWNLVDYIPDLDAPLTKRGGWSYGSNDISVVKATASYVVAGSYAPFAAASKNCAIDEDGEFYTIASSLTVTDVGLSNASVPKAPLAFHRNKLIITRGNGTTAPGYYDGTTLGALAGLPPAAIYGTTYKDRTALANTNALPNRVYFSGAGDPTVWDTTNSWVDMSFPVSGVASLRNALIVFSNQRVERIRGATPPPGSDMVLETLFEPGCIDARSIVFFEDNVVFANTKGLFITDGAAVSDLTERGGMLRYWRDLFSTYAPATWTVAGGKHRGWYVLSVMDGATFKDAFMIDIPQNVWVRISNVKAVMMWDAVGTAPETYYGSRAQPRVNSLSSLFSPAAGVKNDADAAAVAPVLETIWFKPTMGKLTWRNLYATYDCQDAAADNPVLTVSFVETPEDTTYTNITDFTGAANTLAETTLYTRARRRLSFPAHGLGFKIAQTNASSVTKLWALEVDAHPREPSRV